MFWACASDPKPEVNPEDAVNDALVAFTYNAQAGRYSEALEQITYDDQLKIIDVNGDWKPEYKAAAKRIKISALQKLHFSLDFQGRLEGMIAVLDEANSKFTMSDEQRSLNLDKVEKNRKEAAKAPADSSKPVAASVPAADLPAPAEVSEPAPEKEETDSNPSPKETTPENLDVDALFK